MNKKKIFIFKNKSGNLPAFIFENDSHKNYFPLKSPLRVRSQSRQRADGLNSHRFLNNPRRGGNLPPAKMRSIFLDFSAQRAEYNYLLPLTFYFLLQPLPPAKMRSIFLDFSAQRAEYNYLLPLTFYFLLQPLPPAKMRSIFLDFSAQRAEYNRDNAAC